MPGYLRTAIRRLSISGYRSIRALELGDLPDLVVVHGPNGAGKSNLLLAAQLALRAAALGPDLPLSRGRAVALSLVDADRSLGLRPDDFHYGGPPEIRVQLDVELGTRAAQVARVEKGRPLGALRLELVVQSVADDQLHYWFERAEVGGLSLGPGEDPIEAENRLHALRVEEEALQRNVVASTDRLARLDALLDSHPDAIEQRELRFDRAAVLDELHAVQQRLRMIGGEIVAFEQTLATKNRLAQRLRRVVLPSLLQVSPAYRVPGGAADPEAALFRAFLSENKQEREATRRLSRRLATTQLFGASADAVALLPVTSATYGEQQVRFNHPTHGELPLRNLGSGEQQVVFMLGQRVITPFPISLLEEPEAHLHTTLMGPFARVLLESVAGEDGPPDVDQLWIATHHHQFALALEYFDVQIVDGATVVNRLPRAKAARHFFEPGPVWEALRQLASSAKERAAVVFRDATGQPVTAAQILDSIDNDPEQRAAREYAEAMTEAMVLAMRQRAEKPQ